MGFVLTKLAWLLVQPSTLLLMLLATGLLLAGWSSRFQRAGRRIAWLALVLIIAAGMLPLSNLVRLPLEERFPAPRLEGREKEFAAIIVLGGAEDGHVGSGRGQLHMNEAAERIVEGARLARRLPSARLVFSGGSGAFQEGLPAGAAIADYWHEHGIPRERILFEERSLTTWQNALETRRLINPKPGERFLLVTSAYHMPRSVGAFRQAGFDVVAYPVDYRLKDRGDLLRLFVDVPSGLRRLDETVKEWLGLLAYRLLGRSSALFPAP